MNLANQVLLLQFLRVQGQCHEMFDQRHLLNQEGSVADPYDLSGPFKTSRSGFWPK
jgi:hypothetical protein